MSLEPDAVQETPEQPSADAGERWRALPERVLPEDAVATQAVPRGPEEVPDAGLAREQHLWGAG